VRLNQGFVIPGPAEGRNLESRKTDNADFRIPDRHAALDVRNDGEWLEHDAENRFALFGIML
jgi:hypothetical protein